MCAASSSRRRVTGLALYAFSVGLGVQLSLNTFFGAIVYYESRFGNAALLRITFACYVASLPVSLGVSWLGGSASSLHSALQRDVALSICCSAVSALLMAVAPFATELSTVLGVCVLLGGLCTLQYCLAYRFVMLLEQNLCCNGWLEVSLSFGFQSSVFVVLAAKRVVGLTVWSDVPAYFWLCASVHFVAIFALVQLLRAGLAIKTEGKTEGLEADAQELVPLNEEEGDKRRAHSEGTAPRKTSLRRRSADFDLPGEKEDVFAEVRTARIEKNQRQTLISSDLWLCLALLVTVFASVYVFSFFGFVPSQYHNDKQFSGNLVAVKLVSDAFARPLSLLSNKPLCGHRALGVLALLRLVVGSVLFFLYTFTDMIYRNNIMVYIFVAVYSASSGLIITAAYQLGRLSGGEVAETSTRVNRMNMSFQSGLSLALVVSFLIESVFL